MRMSVISLQNIGGLLIFLLFYFIDNRTIESFLIKNKKQGGVIMEYLWDYRIAIDLFLGGIGVGIYLLAAYASIAFKEKSYQVTKIGFFVAPFCVGVGVLALMTELGKPLRMVTTFVNVNPTSVTSWGGFLQALFIILGFITIYFVFRYQTDVYEKASFKAIVYIGSFLALAVGIYHGLLLTSLGRSGWENGLIPVMFLVSSLLAGGSLLFVIESVVKKEGAGLLSYPKLLLSLMSVQMLLMILWRISIVPAGSESILAYNNLVNHFGIYWWIFVIILGLVIPFFIAIYFIFKRKGLNVGLSFLISIVILIGSYAFKHIIIYAGQIPLAGL